MAVAASPYLPESLPAKATRIAAPCKISGADSSTWYREIPIGSLSYFDKDGVLRTSYVDAHYYNRRISNAELAKLSST